MSFPTHRLRRLRMKQNVRRMVRETVLSVNDFVYPMFVVHGKGVREEIESMPGIRRFSPDTLVEEVWSVSELKIPAIILFGIPEHKDEVGSEAYAEDGVIQGAIRAIKEAKIDIIVITDVCLCEYTSHGHCGLIEAGDVDNDKTLDLLAKEAVSHVGAGADIVAPSDMMDGRVGAIRRALDDDGYHNTPIMAYSAKYASAFYGPFREAAESTPQFGDRRSYQMDPPNSDEALREIALDIEEGADIVMVKPAMSYLDVIQRVKNEFNRPLAAYNVSGEYSMVKAAAMKGWVDEKRIALEVLTAIKRAGADMILTYFAKDAAPWIKEG